jgi:hypothetical protein
VKASAPADFDQNASRAAWIALVPFAASMLLSEVGAILSVVLRMPAHSRAGQHSHTFVVLYMLSLVPAPVLIASLLVGYSWVRPLAVLLLWSYLTLTITDLVALFGTSLRAALVVAIFLGPQILTLRLVHGARLRSALSQLAKRRHLRWGPGFGWYLVISMCALFINAVVGALVAVRWHEAGGPDFVHMRGPPRLIPALIGSFAAMFAVARLPRTRAPAAGLLMFDVGFFLVLIFIGALSVVAAWLCWVALIAVSVALLGLSRPEFRAFCARQAGR